MALVARRRGLTLAQRETLEGYLLLLPWVVGFLAFTAGPILASFYLGFTNWQLQGAPEWVGFTNYVDILIRDPLFWQSLKVTAVYSAGALPLSLVMALAVALLMNQKVPGITIFRTIYYLPAVVSGVAVAILWMWVFNNKYGVLNYFIGLLGVEGPNWLTDESWVMPAFILMGLWGIGGGMIIYLAGLQNIPTELYEAAAIDGAGWWMRFWSVTIPMLSPTIFFNLVMGIIGTLQMFTSAFIMTSGGPNYATHFYALYLYFTGFRYLRMGYASALAWLLFLMILALTLLVFKSSSYWVYYAGAKEERKR